jgi:hypothetical protein
MRQISCFLARIAILPLLLVVMASLVICTTAGEGFASVPDETKTELNEGDQEDKTRPSSLFARLSMCLGNCLFAFAAALGVAMLACSDFLFAPLLHARGDPPIEGES